MGISPRTATPEYRAWVAMRHRCYVKTTRDYANYGGRGITVCERWRESYDNFLADMGCKPSPRHSIDRIDNFGPYSPENCRWATQSEQNRNRRSCRLLEFQGRTQTLVAWVEEYGLTRQTVSYRLRRGWSLGRALTTPRRRVKTGMCLRGLHPLKGQTCRQCAIQRDKERYRRRKAAGHYGSRQAKKRELQVPR